MLALVRDLIFQSRITAIARRQGVAVRLLRDPALLDPQTPGRRLLVDLDLEGALPAAIKWLQATARPAAGVVQHVHVERIREARAGGIDPVITRGRFETVLPGWLAGDDQQPQATASSGCPARGAAEAASGAGDAK